MNSIHQEVLTIDKYCINLENNINDVFNKIQEEIINEIKIIINYPMPLHLKKIFHLKSQINNGTKDIVGKTIQSMINILKEKIIIMFLDKSFKMQFINKTDINNSCEIIEKTIHKIFIVIQEKLIIEINTNAKKELTNKLEKLLIDDYEDEEEWKNKNFDDLSNIIKETIEQNINNIQKEIITTININIKNELVKKLSKENYEEHIKKHEFNFSKFQNYEFNYETNVSNMKEPLIFKYKDKINLQINEYYIYYIEYSIDHSLEYGDGSHSKFKQFYAYTNLNNLYASYITNKKEEINKIGKTILIPLCYIELLKKLFDDIFEIKYPYRNYKECKKIILHIDYGYDDYNPSYKISAHYNNLIRNIPNIIYELVEKYYTTNQYKLVKPKETIIDCEKKLKICEKKIKQQEDKLLKLQLENLKIQNINNELLEKIDKLTVSMIEINKVNKELQTKITKYEKIKEYLINLDK
jgi:hypothetical protein